MGRKRKRAQPGPSRSLKRPKHDATRKPDDERMRPWDSTSVQHPTLSPYYATLLTLRAYLLLKLPKASKARRRRISTFGLPRTGQDGALKAPQTLSDADVALAGLLDSTLVGLCEQSADQVERRREELVAFSQDQLTDANRSGLESDGCAQSEVVDWTVWYLFHKLHPKLRRPPHLLCHGYERCQPHQGTTSAVDAVQPRVPNEHINRIKGPLWDALLGMLGKDRERLMLELLIYEAIFCPVGAGVGNYVQISGTPMTDLKPRSIMESAPATERARANKNLHSAGSMSIVRNRMLYARAALNAKGNVRFGLRHIHVLNRFPDARDPAHTAHIMKYVFPRQFGLHNVFTSVVDRRETAQPFKDYTMREEEIEREAVKAEAAGRPRRHKLPKRLRRAPFDLVARWQRRHARCAYTELLRYYCPVNNLPDPVGPVGPESQRLKLDMSGPGDVSKTDNASLVHESESGVINQAQKDVDNPAEEEVASQTEENLAPPAETPSFLGFATPSASVSAFCRAILCRVVPDGFWGEDDVQRWNRELFLTKVDRFVTQRRFESLSLHEVLQGFKIHHIAWLVPPTQDPQSKTSKLEFEKRLQLFSEFIYYLFDSFLIPLIRSNFHVTETSVHRNRLFFFRHDVWRSLSEPALASLCQSMFQEIPPDLVKPTLASRPLGCSQMRLLPKAVGVRPIMNLRRRVASVRRGKLLLGQSINSVMAPVHEVLKYEKALQPDRLGGALFSVGDMYPRLKQFKDRLFDRGQPSNPLYFVKVDVQACFDRIPQERVLALVEALASEDEYRIGRHAEIRPPEGARRDAVVPSSARPLRRFLSSARGPADFCSFGERVEDSLATGRKNTIFVDGVVQKTHSQDALLGLLEEHIRRNLVKVGKRIYRQKVGIPQGSVLSSMLCNLFYGDFERTRLGFLLPTESLLLRMIDDFLLITSNRDHAERFSRIMHRGDADYGIVVKRSKSLANFSAQTDDGAVPQLDDSRHFPFCGNLIHTRTLDLSKDRARRKDAAVADTLTVDVSKLPGHTFQRKALTSFKIQAHAMFFDGSVNSTSTVMANLHQMFIEAAMKMYRYVRCLAVRKQPKPAMLIRTIDDMVKLALNLVRHRSQSGRYPGFNCPVTRTQIRWLSATAFHLVLCRKQSKYGIVLRWLEDSIRISESNAGIDRPRLRQATMLARRGFRGYRF